MNQNPEIQAAMETAEKARQGVRIAKADFIPDVGAFAQYTGGCRRIPGILATRFVPMSQPVIYTSVARSSRRNRNCSRSQGGYRPTLAESECFSEAAALAAFCSAFDARTCMEF